jgi:hypothetical protein
MAFELISVGGLMTPHGRAWIAAGCAGFVAGAFLLWQARGRARRRRYFADRERLAAADWFERHYPTREADRELIQRILQSLAEEIGVDWTQLRPADAFESALRVASRYAAYDDLDNTEDVVVDVLLAHGVPRDQWPGFTGTLGTFLDRMVCLCGGGRSGWDAVEG